MRIFRLTCVLFRCIRAERICLHACGLIHERKAGRICGLTHLFVCGRRAGRSCRLTHGLIRGRKAGRICRLNHRFLYERRAGGIHRLICGFYLGRRSGYIMVALVSLLMVSSLGGSMSAHGLSSPTTPPQRSSGPCRMAAPCHFLPLHRQSQDGIHGSTGGGMCVYVGLLVGHAIGEGLGVFIGLRVSSSM